MTSSYDAVYAESRRDPEGFWAKAAAAIDWTRKWDRVLDDSAPPFYRWFPGGELNTCYNCLDRHVAAGRGGQAALIYDSPMTDTVQTFTYDELLAAVARFAGVLVELGVGKGDRVLIYMPMVPEAAVAMLACARIGAVHSVVFGGFAANELAIRVDDAGPVLVVTASCGIEPNRVVEYMPLLNGALEIATHKVAKVVVLQRDRHRAELTAGRDVDWHAAMAAAVPADCVPVAATDPLYILYTSGTTGRPKGVVRDNGGHAVALQWSMPNIYGVAPGDVWWTASDVGWVVGHSYIVYAPLLHGATSVLFEGKPVGTPDPGTFWRIISQHKVKRLFTAPTAFRAIKQQDPTGTHVKQHDISCFEVLFLAGERADPDTIHWAEEQLKVPVIDHWWQTETGWPIAANCMGLGQLPVKYGSPTKAVPGYDVRVVDEANRELARGEMGAIVIRLPMPPGCLPTLWRDDDNYVRSYLEDYPGYYKTADAGYIDSDDYIYIMSRTDDIINVAGHRLSTGAMEEVLASHPDVAECAVIGVADPLKGQAPLGFVVLSAGVERDRGELVGELIGLVRERIGPVADFKRAAVIQRLPKTRSGKVLRGTMSKIADGEPWTLPATIDDPAILDEIAEALRELGYAGG